MAAGPLMGSWSVKKGTVMRCHLDKVSSLSLSLSLSLSFRLAVS